MLSQELIVKILDTLDTKDSINFILFKDKAIEDADTVARLEETIKELSELDTIQIYNNKGLQKILKVILYGDKPNDSRCKI